MGHELLILRHAKSDWHTNAKTDFDRPLNKRGKRDASRIGAWMAEQNIRPDLIICSSAKRTRQTAKRVIVAASLPADVCRFEESLYLADLDTLIQTIQSQPEKFMRLMLIGHNPGMEELLQHLLGSSCPTPKDHKLLPTAALAHIAINGNWSDSLNKTAQLIKLQRVKDLN